jgi:hypothetical protein
MRQQVRERRRKRKAVTWRSRLSEYAEQRILTFHSDDDLDLAIELLWTEELRGLPHETPDGQSIIVPAEAVSYFAAAGLRFVDKRLRSIRELRGDEIQRLRR